MNQNPNNPDASNAELHARLLDLLGENCCVLTETERMAHQLLHDCRLGHIAAGKDGWEAPAVSTFNRWMERFWEGLWPVESLAARFVRWRVLRDILPETGRPEEFEADATLVEMLDESFEHCLRYGIDPGAGDPANRLAEWRRSVWKVFRNELSARELFHPAELARRILDALEDGRGTVEPRIAAAGFEFAGFWEKKVLAALAKRTEFSLLPLPAGRSEPRTVLHSDPEQELYGLLEDLTGAASLFPLHKIAVVLLDSVVYGPPLSRHLNALFGTPLTGDLAAYNLIPDRTLNEQPLFSAAFLPLTFGVRGETREDLLALLRSPYYDRLAGSSRKLSLCDVEWRKDGADSGFERLFAAIGRKSSGIPAELASLIRGLLAPFLNGASRACSRWSEDLQRVWTMAGFPSISSELDRISWTDLSGLLSGFISGFGDSRMNAAEFFDLVSRGASGIKVQRSGSEEAGIQVIGWLEARGLVFEKLFVPGMVAGALPRAVRPLPLLSSVERKKVLGGSIESVFAFAGHLFGNFLAAAPEVVLSRPMLDAAGETVLPSPFWPEGAELKKRPVIPWKDELPAMHRARWVRETVDGISQGPGGASRASGDPERFKVARLDLPQISVTALEALLLCPGKYFFQYVLGIEELPEPEKGLSPLDRGRLLHGILASFVKKVISAGENCLSDFDGMAGMLRETVKEQLGRFAADAAWRVEERRLVGEESYPGLLMKWLREEWPRLQAGWRWEAAESGFRDLEARGCAVPISGRLDRIDSHPDEGVVCWDYKSGRAPGRTAGRELASPQLPAYLLAMRKGLAGRTPHREPSGLGAGYIELGSVGKFRHSLQLKPGDEHGKLLDDWEEKIARAINSLCGGDISPLWLGAGGPCKEDREGRCPYRGICGFI